MTGDDLRRAREAAGLSGRALARLAGITHKALQYWEAKPRLDPRAHAVKALARALGWGAGEFRDMYAPARDGVLPCAESTDRLLALLRAHMVREAARRTRLRVICGAKTRKGTPCRAKSEPGRRRCRFHGGRSTGAKTPEGRARIAEAQRRRWARWRAERAEVGGTSRL